MTGDEFEAEDADQPRYVYRPSAFAAPRSFRLSQRGIEWDIGRRSGHLDFSRIRQVKMIYRPATMAAYRFITEVSSPDAPRLKIASVSAKNMVELTNQGDEYRAFVTEMHRRLAEAGTPARFQAGIHPLMYWPGLVAFTAAGVGFTGLTIRAISEGAGLAALLIAGFLLLFLWQAGNIFYRNKPGTYRPDALPPMLLPRPKT
jgi:hypothetical protein